MQQVCDFFFNITLHIFNVRVKPLFIVSLSSVQYNNFIKLRWSSGFSAAGALDSSILVFPIPPKRLLVDCPGGIDDNHISIIMEFH